MPHRPIRIPLLFLPLGLAACAGSPPPPAATPEPANPPPSTPSAGPEVRLPWRMARLENGLTLLMHADTTLPTVGVEVWIRGGSREEAPGQFGVAHLFEHYLPGTGRFLRNAENRARRGQYSRGGNAGTDPDFVRFWSESTPEGLEFAVGYLADRLESADTTRFSQEWLTGDQDVVASELRRSMGTEWDVQIQGALHRGTFGADHPYGHSVGGLEADVRAATTGLMRDWHRRFAGAASSIVLIAGNFDPARAEAMVRHHFGSIRPGPALARPTEWVPPARPLREVLEMETARGLSSACASGRTAPRWTAPLRGWSCGRSPAPSRSAAPSSAARTRPRARRCCARSWTACCAKG